MTVHSPCSNCGVVNAEFYIDELCVWCKYYGGKRPAPMSSTIDFSTLEEKIIRKISIEAEKGYDVSQLKARTIPKEGLIMTRDKLYEYAILFHGKPTKDEAERNVRVRSKVLIHPTTILARDEAEVRLMAARDIPEEYLDRSDQIEVLVVPFE